MATTEDCASVLEQFVHDVGNLPQEISHYFEEMTAKDHEMQEALKNINSKDGALQKHVRLNGGLTKHPKEEEFAETVTKAFDAAISLQEQKVGLSEKACALLERQLKKLDVKIRELQNDGQLLDGPTLPSVFNRKPLPDKALTDLPVPGLGPLQPSSNSILNMNIAASRLNGQIAANTTPLPRQISQITGLPMANARSSAPASPTATQQNRSHRESSVGAVDSKRRKLNNASYSLNAPSQPSGLRQSSLGPSVTASGTPKAGTPTGTSAAGARSGSVPRTSGSQASSVAPGSGASTKKSSLSKRVGPVSHQQISKLKGKPLTKHARLSNASITASGRKKGASPSVRGRGAAGSDDNDSVLSSADVSDADTASRHTSLPPSQQTTGAAGTSATAGATTTTTHRGRRSKKELEALAAAQQGVSTANAATTTSTAATRPKSTTASSSGAASESTPSEPASEPEEEVSDEEEEDEEDDDDDNRRYCFCNERSYGEMVACENDKCPYEWFHLACVGMKKAPDDDEVWYCPECRGKFNWNVTGTTTGGTPTGNSLSAPAPAPVPAMVSAVAAAAGKRADTPSARSEGGRKKGK